jgi:hypothetical protein
MEIHVVDAETIEKFAALEAEVAELKAQLAGRAAPGKVVYLKQLAPELNISVETLRRRIMKDPAWQKVSGRWVKRG